MWLRACAHHKIDGELLDWVSPCCHRKWREDCEAISPRSQQERREKFHLGHVLIKNRGWMSVWDVFSTCLQRE